MYFVIQRNEHGIEIFREKFDDMSQAKSCIVTDLLPDLEVGDSIKIEDA